MKTVAPLAMEGYSATSRTTRARHAGVALIWLVGTVAPLATAQTASSADTDHQARQSRHREYEAARAKARTWLDGLEVDAVAISKNGMKGQKKLAEIMDIYLFLSRTSEQQDRVQIDRRARELAFQTNRDEYHNMQVCSDREFKQNSMSYLRVMWLMREFGLDTTRYGDELLEVKPRMDSHLSSRGAWQRAMFAQYYERFGMQKPAPIRNANIRTGLVKRRTRVQDYDRKRSYQLTHEVFVAFDYGYARETSEFDRGDVDYLRTTLPPLLMRALEHRDTDLASELTSAMVLLGWYAHPTVEQAIDYLLKSQNQNGSWGHYEAARSRYGDYVEQNFYLHTTGAALRALVGYFE